uniref:Uncharacterized protein n=1 Tax=Hippocampus comes TaxID=109280 RepID=A0A3Q2XC45_HIPCM
PLPHAKGWVAATCFYGRASHYFSCLTFVLTKWCLSNAARWSLNVTKLTRWPVMQLSGLLSLTWIRPGFEKTQRIPVDCCPDRPPYEKEPMKHICTLTYKSTLANFIDIYLKKLHFILQCMLENSGLHGSD